MYNYARHIATYRSLGLVNGKYFGGIKARRKFASKDWFGGDSAAGREREGELMGSGRSAPIPSEGPNCKIFRPAFF